MCGNDAYISRTQLDELYLAWRTTGECDQSRTEAAEAQRIVRCLKDGGFLGRGGELVEMETVLNGNGYP